MKIKGKTIEAPKPVDVIIPRAGGDDLYLKCAAVIDFTPFEKVCPEPRPPMVMKPGQGSFPDATDRGYLERLAEYQQRRTDWMFITSLSATIDLTWDTVDINDPSTYGNIHTEMEKVLTPSQINRVIGGIMEANVPTPERQKEAMARFQRSQVQEAKVPLLEAGEHGFTQSGGLAKE